MSNTIKFSEVHDPNSFDVDPPVRFLEPALRDTFPKSWRGFDLRGMKAGWSFFGCQRCGVQVKRGYIGTTQCPNCLGNFEIFTVTPEDLDAA